MLPPLRKQPWQQQQQQQKQKQKQKQQQQQQQQQNNNSNSSNEAAQVVQESSQAVFCRQNDSIME